MIHQHKSRKPQQSRASLIITIVLAFLLIVGAAVLVTQLPDDESWQLPDKTSGTDQEQLSGFPCESAEAQNLYPFGDYVIRVANERIVCLDILGSERYSFDVDFQTPYVTANQCWLLIADRESRGYVMMTPEGEAFRGRLTGLIRGSAISADGTVALIQEQEGGTGIVTILEAQTGRHLFDCFFPESGHVLSVAFTEDGNAFDVAIVNTDAAQIQMIVKRFGLDGNPEGQLMPELNDLSPLLIHQRQEQVVLAGYNRLTAFKYDQDEPVWVKDYGQLHAVAEQGGALLAVASEKPDGTAKLYRVAEDGTQMDLMSVGDRVVSLAVFDKMVAIGNGSRVRLLDTKSDDIYEDVTMQSDVIRLAFSGSDSLIVITHNGVRRIDIDNQ